MIVPRASSQTHRCFHYVCIYIPMRVIESELNLNMSLISIRLNCVLCKQNASGTSVVDPRQPRFVLLPTLPGAPGIILKRIRAININIKMRDVRAAKIYGGHSSQFRRVAFLRVRILQLFYRRDN